MKTILPVVTLLMLAASVQAVPPPPWFAERAEDGLVDARQYIASYRDAVSRGVDSPNPLYGPGHPPFGPAGAISSARDEMNVLILLVDFADDPARTKGFYFDSMGFAADTFSLARYYGEVSFGQIRIVTVDWPSEAGWLRAPETYEYYVGDDYGWGSYPTNSQGLVEAVCRLADPTVDFSDYDNDGDGYVDGVNVMYAGQFDGTPQTIWPHAWSLPGGGAEFDGVRVWSYSVQNEYDDVPGDKSASVFCHEFGHVLGLPDLYDYDYDANGVGNWCLMSFGVYNGDGWSPSHLSAWCRAALGVADVVNVTSEGDYAVPSVEESGTIYRLWTDGLEGEEYFLLENRRPIGYDAALPGWGILLWHVDDAVGSNDFQWYPGYTSSGHYHVALEQADGLWELEQAQGYGDAEDPFPGTPSRNATAFDYWTVPDSRDYAFLDTRVAVSGIPESADTVTVHLAVGQTSIGGGIAPTRPTGLSVVSENPSGGPFRFLVSHGGGRAAVSVFDLAGRRIATLWDAPLAAGDHLLTWDPAESAPGIYLLRYDSESGCASEGLLVLR